MPYNKNLIKTAQMLRKHMTPQERKLWYLFLKELPLVFKRQQVLGDYIVDFYCASKKLVLEIDGTQHFLPLGKEKDAKRDAYLQACGLSVLRYSNHEVNTNFDAVCEDILQHLKETRSPL